MESEIDDFIDNIGKYKVLEDRLSRMFTELSEYYEEYKRGKFKGDFIKLIAVARDKVTDLIERVMGEKNIFNPSQTFLEKNTESLKATEPTDPNSPTESSTAPGDSKGSSPDTGRSSLPFSVVFAGIGVVLSLITVIAVFTIKIAKRKIK